MKYELRHNTTMLTEREYKTFNKGETVCGERDDRAEVIATYDTIEEAKKALENYRCSYNHNFDVWHIEEYGFVEEDDGDFGDLYLAEEG